MELITSRLFFFCYQHQASTCVCSHCSSGSTHPSSPCMAGPRHTWTSYEIRGISRGCICGCRYQGCTLHHIPKKAEHGACKKRGTSVWQVCICIVQMCNIKKALAHWKPQRFSLQFFKCCYCVHRVAIAGMRVQILLYVLSIYFSFHF